MNRDLLDAVLARSDDDDARLVYADWCEENGDAARARFIRVQVQRARLSPWDAQQIALRLEEDKLIAEHRETWLAELEPVEGITWTGFERGFPAHVEADSFEALAAGRDTLAQQPLSHVRTPWPQDETLARSVALPTLRSVRIDRAARHEEPHWLAASPLVSTLTKLTLVDDYADDSALRALFGATRQLQTLELRRDFGVEGFQALFDAELEHLQSLSVQETEPDDGTSYYLWTGGLKPKAIELLGGWSRLSKLEHLDLSVNRLRAEDFAPLFDSPHFRVRSLRLDQVWAQLNRLPWRTAKSQLKGLSLRLNSFREGVEALVPAMDGLRVLDLRGSTFTESEELALLVRRIAPTIELLDLRCRSVGLHASGGCAVDALSQIACARLHTLHVAVPSSSEWVAEFVSWLTHHEIRSLWVDAPRQSDFPCALAAAELPSLERLVLRNVDAAAKAVLGDSPLGRRLIDRDALRFRVGRPWFGANP